MRTFLLDKNIGLLDRGFRVALGVTLLSFVFVGPQTPWALIGVVPLLTGLFARCPVYSMFGFRTC